MPSRGPGYDIFGPAILGPVQVQQAGIDLHQENSQTAEYSAGLEREFARDWVFEATYVGSRSKYLEQNVQPNNAQPRSLDRAISISIWRSRDPSTWDRGGGWTSGSRRSISPTAGTTTSLDAS